MGFIDSPMNYLDLLDKNRHAREFFYCDSGNAEVTLFGDVLYVLGWTLSLPHDPPRIYTLGMTYANGEYKFDSGYTLDRFYLYISTSYQKHPEPSGTDKVAMKEFCEALMDKYQIVKFVFVMDVSHTISMIGRGIYDNP